MRSAECGIDDRSKKYKCQICDAPFIVYYSEAYYCPSCGSTGLQLVNDDEWLEMMIDQINKEFRKKPTKDKRAKKTKRASVERSEEISELPLLFDAEFNYYITFPYIY